MGTHINYPQTNVNVSRKIIRPLMYLDGEVFTVYKVRCKRSDEEGAFMHLRLMKVGGNLFVETLKQRRYKIRQSYAGYGELFCLNDVPGKKPLAIYEIWECSTIINIGEEKHIAGDFNKA